MLSPVLYSQYQTLLNKSVLVALKVIAITEIVQGDYLDAKQGPLRVHWRYHVSGPLEVPFSHPISRPLFEGWVFYYFWSRNKNPRLASRNGSESETRLQTPGLSGSEALVHSHPALLLHPRRLGLPREWRRHLAGLSVGSLFPAWVWCPRLQIDISGGHPQPSGSEESQIDRYISQASTQQREYCKQQIQ